MPSSGDWIVLFVLALLLFGPKKLPMLARELGKWIGEFRRASNEFKMQMDEEIRQAEAAERLKKLEAVEAAAPKPPAFEASTEPTKETGDATSAATVQEATTIAPEAIDDIPEKMDGVTPLPIATSGELSIMPPSTGLPTPQARTAPSAPATEQNALSGLIDSIPAMNEPTTPETPAASTTENPTHAG